MTRRLSRTCKTSRNYLPALAALAALSLALTCLPAAPCRAADPPLDGPGVLAKYAAAVGGVAAWDSLHNSVTQSVMTYQGTNSVMNITEYRARPDKIYTRVDVGNGKVLAGVFEGNAWNYSVTSGSRLLEAQEQADAVRDANFDDLVHWRASYRVATLAGVDSTGGRPQYKVLLKPRLGTPETVYFDVETGLRTRSEGQRETQANGLFPVKTEYTDYRKVGNVTLPFKMTSDVLGMRLVVSVVEVQYNVEMDADRFDPPSEVKDLIKARGKP